MMGVDLISGELIHSSRDWSYDEAEGLFPDDKSIAAEREKWSLQRPSRACATQLNTQSVGCHDIVLACSQ